MRRFFEGRRLRPALAAALALALCAPAFADDAPRFVIHTADGKSVEGPLRELGPNWSVRVGDASLAGGDVLTVRRSGRPFPPRPEKAQLLLAGGDLVPVVFKPGEKEGPRLVDDRIHFRCPGLAGGDDASVPLSGVIAVWYGGPGGEQAERMRRRLAGEKHKGDVVLMKNGDVLEGVLTALDFAEATIEVDGKPVKVDVHRTSAVALSSELTEAPKPQGVYARLVLDAAGEIEDGARLSLASARCADGATLTGETLFGAAVSVPLAKVAALDLLGGRAVYVSELTPSRYEFFPYLDEHWDWSCDSDLAGLDLRLAGSTFDRGVAMHSHARLTYAVPKDGRAFEALVGLDDRGSRGGGARVRVLADGKPLDLGGAGDVTPGAALPIRVDTAGAKELTLEVDFGQGGPVRDHVDWVDARFVK